MAASQNTPFSICNVDSAVVCHSGPGCHRWRHRMDRAKSMGCHAAFLSVSTYGFDCRLACSSYRSEERRVGKECRFILLTVCYNVSICDAIRTIYNVYIRKIHLYIFFFQAEDGIRDRNVTGVQTCALPISIVLLCVIPAQAVIGGVTVWTGLNPWVVMLHFLVSALMVSIAALLAHR